MKHSLKINFFLGKSAVTLRLAGVGFALMQFALSGPLYGQNSLAPMSYGNYIHTRQTLAQYPQPALPGVDLTWHMDRIIEYMGNTIDRRTGVQFYGYPFYANNIYWGAAWLKHSQWDVPHSAGRVIDAMMMWEEAANEQVPDEQVINLLRGLLQGSIKSDHLVHFPAYWFPGEAIDGHSQREALLALMGMYKMRGDSESLALAEQLVTAYDNESRFDALNCTESGRIIWALVDYHELTGNSLALQMAEQFTINYHDNFFTDPAWFPRPGNNQSTLETIGGILRYAFYTNQLQYVAKMKSIIDTGLWEARSEFGAIFENMGPRNELNCSGVMVKIDIMLGMNGYPEYFNDAERIVRNHLSASQYLDPTIATGLTGLSDDLTDYNDVPARARGGHAFTLANDLIEPELGGLDIPVDTAAAVMHGFVKTWEAIITQDGTAKRVNLLFSKITPELEVRSYIPSEGRVELNIFQPMELYVRIPDYVEKASLSLVINGMPMSVTMSGSYLYVPQQPNSAIATITFVQKVNIKTEIIAGTTYEVQWLGDTVWQILPEGPHVPLYYPARLALYGTYDHLWTDIPSSWDVKADWRYDDNPNGFWVYRDATRNVAGYPEGSLLRKSNSQTVGGAPAGWERASDRGPTLFNDIWQPFGPGVGGNDASSIGGHGPWMVAWESPIDSWIQISGRAFQMFTGPRMTYFMIRHNDKVFTDFYAPLNAEGTEALGGPENAVDFAEGSGGAGVLLRRVYPGDVIDVIAQGSLGPNGTGTDSASTFAALQMHVDIADTFTLTMSVSPPEVTTVSPSAGQTLAFPDTSLVISAWDSVDCPVTMSFGHWEGEGISDPNSASTQVLMDMDKTITAIFIENNQCGDQCYPVPPFDFNADCIVDLKDFCLFADHWLYCTRPECD